MITQETGWNGPNCYKYIVVSRSLPLKPWILTALLFRSLGVLIVIERESACLLRNTVKSLAHNEILKLRHLSMDPGRARPVTEPGGLA